MPTKVIRVSNKNALLNDDSRHAFDFKQEVLLQWTLDLSLVCWDVLVRCQVSGSEVSAEDGSQFNIGVRDVLINAQYPARVVWSTLKSAEFGSTSSLHPLLDVRAELVCESIRRNNFQIILTVSRPGILDT